MCRLGFLARVTKLVDLLQGVIAPMQAMIHQDGQHQGSVLMSRIINAIMVFVLVMFAGYTMIRPAIIAQQTTLPGRVVQFNIKEEISSYGKTSKLVMTALLPQSLPHRQEVLDIQYSPKPDRIFYRNGNRYAQFTLTNLPSQTEINISGRMRLYNFDLKNLQRTGIKDNMNADTRHI